MEWKLTREGSGQNTGWALIARQSTLVTDEAYFDGSRWLDDAPTGRRFSGPLRRQPVAWMPYPDRDDERWINYKEQEPTKKGRYLVRSSFGINILYYRGDRFNPFIEMTPIGRVERFPTVYDWMELPQFSFEELEKEEACEAGRKE